MERSPSAWFKCTRGFPVCLRRLFLPWTCSMAEASVLPTLFSEVQVYIPSSSSFTWNSRRMLPLWISNLWVEREEVYLLFSMRCWSREFNKAETNNPGTVSCNGYNCKCRVLLLMTMVMSFDSTRQPWLHLGRNYQETDRHLYKSELED